MARMRVPAWKRKPSRVRSKVRRLRNGLRVKRKRSAKKRTKEV